MILKQQKISFILMLVLIFVVSLNLFYAEKNYKRSYISNLSLENYNPINHFTQTINYLKDQEKQKKSVQISCYKNDSWYNFVGLEYYGYPDSLRWSQDPNRKLSPTADIVVSCDDQQILQLGYKLINEKNFGDLKIYEKL